MMIGGGCIFSLVAALMVVFFAEIGGPIAIFPFLFLLFGLALAARGIWKLVEFQNAPLERVPVAVVDERVEVSGGGQNSSASTDYYVTVETRDGARDEYELHGELAGEVAAGDLGIGYLKGGYFVDFVRLDV